MSVATPHMSFRFPDGVKAQLDYIVGYQKARLQNSWQVADVNRTEVLRVLIELEVHRIKEEEQKQRELMEKRTLADVLERDVQMGAKQVQEWLIDEEKDKKETARQRKTRLQKERREKARKKK